MLPWFARRYSSRKHPSFSVSPHLAHICGWADALSSEALLITMSFQYQMKRSPDSHPLLSRCIEPGGIPFELWWWSCRPRQWRSWRRTHCSRSSPDVYNGSSGRKSSKRSSTRAAPCRLWQHHQSKRRKESTHAGKYVTIGPTGNQPPGFSWWCQTKGMSERGRYAMSCKQSVHRCTMWLKHTNQVEQCARAFTWS